MEIPDSAEATPVSLIDASEPLKNIVVCCTAIPQEGRQVIAERVEALGGVHKYDLTPDVTHLVVGDYDTPKYRHVARERPDIKPMDAAWLEAVTEIWKTGEDDFDFVALETKHTLKTFEKCGSMPKQFAGDHDYRLPLLICLTGFGDAREGIAERIDANGGKYTGDLTRKCTHLVVHAPEGKKFTAAKNWGIRTVTLSWLEQSLERGMILEEDKFDPLLPIEEQGLGAWIKKDSRSPGKRTRSGTADSRGPRKLRKTASMKLKSQSDGLWGDILGKSTSNANSFAESKKEATPIEKKATPPEAQLPAVVKPAPVQEPRDQGIYSQCAFYIHGFPPQRAKILSEIITSLAGTLASSLPSLSTTDAANRFLIVPQASQPDTHPQLPSDNIHIVTEFYVEKCLHNKHLFDPNEHVLGRPFPLFPIPDMQGMAICTAAFTGIELSQVSRAAVQLGARFEEEFRKEVDVLVVRSLSATRREKLRCALEWGVPVVKEDWLWECVSTGCKVPLEDFGFSQLKRRQSGEPQGSKRSQGSSGQASLPPTAVPGKALSRSKSVGVDNSGFDTQPATSKKGTKNESTTSADFQTAATHPQQQSDSSDSALTELSSASVNKAAFQRTASVPLPTSTKQPLARAPSAPQTVAEQQEESVKKPSLQEALAAFSRRRNQLEKETEEQRQRLEEERQRGAEKAATKDEMTEEERVREEKKQQAAAAHAQEREQLNSNLDSLLTHALPSPPPKKRARKVFGRAMSGASTTSSAAADPPAPISKEPSSPQYQPDEDSQEREKQRKDGEEEEGMSGTQLGYADPEAQVAKRLLMRKMTGEGGEQEEVKKEGRGVIGGGRALRSRT